MDVKHEIEQYIIMNETPGVLLLTGSWGCGKSHLMKEIAREYDNTANAKDEHKRSKRIIVIVSLFGIDSIPDLDKAVKREILKCKYGISDRNEKMTKKIFSGVGSAFEMTGAFIPAFSAAKPLMSVNLLDFIDITNKVGDKELILVFDDFERCNNIQRDVLLGYINDLSENKQIKVIIIADETKLQTDDRYKEYKEKIISRTVYLDNNYDVLICQIVDAYKETEPNYQSFLRTNVSLIQQVFAESGKNNVRILKYILADFERIYASWISTDVPHDNLPFVLYTFAAEYYIKRQPPIKDPQIEHKGLLFSYAAKENEQYLLKGSHKSSLYSVSEWINTGSWDEKQFKNELRNRYGKAELSPEQAFLWKNFWDLTQMEIEQGLPKLVNHAYDGLLSHDELITLIQKIHWLKHCGLSLPCDVDYGKVENGLWTRFEAIKKNKIIEPHITSFADIDSIDIEAKPVNAILEQMEYYISVFQNRNALLDYLHNPEYLTRHRFKNQVFCEFDDEIRNVFLTSYSKADNGSKRELAHCLIGVDFYSSDLSRREMIECSLKNYTLIVAEIEKISSLSADSMERMICRSFIEKIKEKISELSEKTKAGESD